MDDLLSTFDPLHARHKEALFPPRPAPTSAASSSKSTTPLQLSAVPVFAVPVALSQAPLDHLAFTEQNHTPLFHNGVHAVPDVQPVTAKAAARQYDILSELHSAEQHVDWQSASHPSISPATTMSSENAVVPNIPVRPGRSGFSPPRRMSKSGLMRDDEPARPHSQPQESIPAEPSASPLSIDNPHKQSPFPPGPASPTGLTSEPSKLFHPSSPPGGKTLESLKYANNYFTNAAKNSGRARRASASEGRSSAERKHGIPSQSQKAEMKGAALSTSDAALVPQPASISSMDGQKENDHLSPRLSNTKSSLLPSPSSSSLSWTAKLKGKSTSRSPDVTSVSPKPHRKQHYFDFPTSFAEDQVNNKSSRSSPVSATHSLNIDSEPLPSVLLKIPAAAKSSNKVLTEDIADGVRDLKIDLHLCIYLLRYRRRFGLLCLPAYDFANPGVCSILSTRTAHPSQLFFRVYSLVFRGLLEAVYSAYRI